MVLNSVSAAAEAILAALRRSDGEAAEKSGTPPPWSREACGVRLRTFAAMRWRPDMVSPASFALRGWRCEAQGTAWLVCDECGARRAPGDDVEHEKRCSWYGVRVSEAVWDGADDDDRRVDEAYARHGWTPVTDTLLECRFCGEQLDLVERDDEHEDDDARFRRATKDPVLAHRWFCPYRRAGGATKSSRRLSDDDAAAAAGAVAESRGAASRSRKKPRVLRS
mmetsp:Transcript_17803/g.54424  ORF Transcript_17803/g.54424 Transcript_17803/m.54424 type:complete len:223 (+) Transcript_17803:1473-2141(+)